MSETPSWLAGGNDAPAPTSASLEVTAPASSPTAASTQGATDADEKELPGVILMMRLTNMGMAGGIITAAVSTTVLKESLPEFALICHLTHHPCPPVLASMHPHSVLRSSH